MWPSEAGQVGQEAIGVAFAGADARGARLVVDRHEVDLGADAVPPAHDRRGQAEVAHAEAAALLVQERRQLFEHVPFEGFEALVGQRDERVHGPDPGQRDRVCQGGQPRLHEVVG